MQQNNKNVTVAQVCPQAITNLKHAKIALTQSLLVKKHKTGRPQGKFPMGRVI